LGRDKGVCKKAVLAGPNRSCKSLAGRSKRGSSTLDTVKPWHLT
jgi:hypothetical protein